MTEQKKRQIKQKIEAGKARHAARAKGGELVDRASEAALSASHKAAELARAHPMTTVAAALAVGVLISGLFRGSPTRKAATAAGSRASGLARIGTELALAWAARAASAAGEARHASADRLGDLGDALGDTARRIGSAGEKARDRVADVVQRRAH